MATQTASDCYHAAISDAQTGKFDASMRNIRQAIALNPADMNYRVYQAYVHFMLGELAESLLAYDACLAVNPLMENVWISRNEVAKRCSQTRSLELGCGIHLKNSMHAQESYGIDIREDLAKNIYKADLTLERIPFPDDHFDYVIAEHFIEHIPRLIYAGRHRYPFIELMNEVWRVLKPHGLFYAITPAYPHPEVFQDPTHVNIITDKTFPAYFSYALPWAHQYGFTGRFNFTKQDWEGPCLRTWMNKISKPSVPA